MCAANAIDEDMIVMSRGIDVRIISVDACCCLRDFVKCITEIDRDRRLYRLKKTGLHGEFRIKKIKKHLSQV